MDDFLAADVGLLVPLDEEFEELTPLLSGRAEPYRIDGVIYFRLRVPGADDLSVWATKLTEMGNGPSLDRTARMIRDIKPRMVICCGIAGSLRKDDLALGDVAMSRSVADIIDAAKVGDSGDTYAIQTVNRPFSPPEKIVGYFSNLEQILGPELASWRQACRVKSQALGLHQHGNDTDKWPRLEVCKFASGIVLASDRFNLRSGDREMKIVETEGAGMGRAAQSHREDFPFVVIRGVSDLADSAKNRLEEQSKRGWRRLAAHNAFSLTLTVLADPGFRVVLADLAQGSPSGITRFPMPRMTHAQVGKLLVEEIFTPRESKGSGAAHEETDVLVRKAPEVWRELAALRLDGPISKEWKVLKVLLDYAEFFLLESSEHPAIRLGRAESVLEKIRGYYLKRAAQVDTHPVGSRFHFIEAYVAHRKGLLRKAVESINKAREVARECGEKDDVLTHQRCLHCMECELLTTASRPLFEAHLKAIREVDAGIVKLQEDPKRKPGDSYGLIRARFFNAMVAAKACVFAAQFDEKSFGRELKGARKLLDVLGEGEARGGRQYEMCMGLWRAYNSIYLRRVKKSAKKAHGERVEALKLIRDGQILDNCCLRLPTSEAGWLEIDSDA